MKILTSLRTSCMGIITLFAAMAAQAQWIQTSGPQCGEVTALGQKGDTLWAGTGSGMFCSIDSGIRWSFHSMPQTSFHSIHANAAGIFAGTNSQSCYRLNASGVWEQLTGGLSKTTSVYSITTWRQRMFLANYMSIYWSDDNGTTWTPCTSQPATSAMFAVAAHPGYLLSCSWGNGVFRSADSGATWTAINAGLPASPGARRLFVADTVIFVFLDGGLYRSTNNGDNWAACSGPSGLFGACQGISSVNDTVFLSSDTTIFRSIDFGATWASSFTLPSQASTGALCAAGRVFMSSHHGIHMSSNKGMTWRRPARNIISGYIPDIIMAGDSLLACIYQTGISRSANNGAAWTLPVFSIYDPQNLAWLGRYLVGKEYSSLLRSSDSGHTWQYFTAFSGGGTISKLLVDGGTLYAATYSRGIFRSTDSGATWDSVNTGLPGRDVRAMCSANGTIFAGVYGQGIFRLDGNAWADVNNGIQQAAAQRTISALVAHGSTVMAGVDSYYAPSVYMTSDLGANWSVADSGVTTLQCMNLHLVDTLIIGVFYFYGPGIFATGDHGASWHAFGDGADSIYLTDFLTIGDTIFAGSEYRGVWKRPLGELNDATKPSAVIPRAQRLRSMGGIWSNATEIVIFDISGRLVRSIQTPPRLVRDILNDKKLLRGLGIGIYLVRTNATGLRTFTVQRVR
jgi:photosystem II stability/assembly factor-like uncharacterized protein